MSIFKLQNLIESKPAYDIYEREAGMYGCIEIDTDDTLGVRHPRGYWDTFSPGSVVSYALKNGKDPIAAIERAKGRGEQLHWIIANSTVITSEPRAKKQLVAVTPGMRVRFEGRMFTIETASNDNLRFVPVAAA